MKVLFAHLPIQNPSWEEDHRDIPYRAATMACLAERENLLARDEWSWLDRSVSLYGSDAAVIEALVALEPDLALFALYPWNLERSMYIADKAKGLLSRTRFVGFGPEAAEGMPVAERSPFNSLLSGDPEMPFVSLMADVKRHKPIARFYRSEESFEGGLLPNPYLSGALPLRKDAPVVLELSRGCSDRCAFCPDGGSRPMRRVASPEDLSDFIRVSEAASVSEVHLLDSSLCGGQGACDLLAQIAAAKGAGLPLHVKARLDRMNSEEIALMKDAGVVSVSTELLSMNPKALEAVDRRLDKDSFAGSAELLQRSKIQVRSGVMLGLPFDGYEQVIESFDFLGMHGLGQDAELEPLSFAPGTAAFERADEWRMSRMDLPPYWVTSNDWISGDDMIDAVAAFEESFDVEWASPPSPHFMKEKSGYRAFVDVRRLDEIDWMRLNPTKLANSITLLADSDDPESLSRLVRAARDLRRDNPFALYQIVLTSDTRIPSERLVGRIQDALLAPDHYYELTKYFSPDPQEGHQTRMFFATRNFALAYRAIEEAQDLETMVVIAGKSGYNAERLADLLPYVIFDKETIAFERLYELLSIYADFPHMLVEAPEDLF